MPDSTNVIAGVDELRARFESRHPDPDPHELGELAAQFDEARDLHNSALESLHRGAGDRALTASEQRRWDSHARQARALEEAAAELRRQLETAKADRVAARRVRWGSVNVAAGSTGRAAAAWDGLDARYETPAGWVARAHDVLEQQDSGLHRDAAERLAAALSSREAADAARIMVARAHPDYAAAFAKVLRSPERALLTLTPQESAAFGLVESTRASMATSVGTAGYLLPLALDPNLSAVVNNGAANPFRANAQVRTTIASPHRAVTSPGITGEWVAEGVAFGDASPSFGKVDIPLHKLAAFVSGSYEIFEDAGQALFETVPLLLADARDVAEATAFAVGDGTTQPKGIVTALVAAGALVTATTRGSFTSASSVDMFNLLNAIPARARQSPKLAMLGSSTIVNIVRTQVVGTGGELLVSIDSAVPKPLGVPLHEASAMTTATTSGSYMAVCADLGKYLVVDHVAGPVLEWVPVLFDQATGRPNGTRGWVYHQRTGADMLDPTMGRVLKS